jgi:hypothetical protein
MLPQRTPRRNTPARTPPEHTGSVPPAAPEAPASRADRIRGELADFRLGQHEAQSKTPGPLSSPGPALSAGSPNGLPELHHSNGLSRRDGEEDKGPGPAEGEADGQAGTEAGPT